MSLSASSLHSDYRSLDHSLPPHPRTAASGILGAYRNDGSICESDVTESQL